MAHGHGLITDDITTPDTTRRAGRSVVLGACPVELNYNTATHYTRPGEAPPLPPAAPRALANAHAPAPPSTPPGDFRTNPTCAPTSDASAIHDDISDCSAPSGSASTTDEPADSTDASDGSLRSDASVSCEKWTRCLELVDACERRSLMLGALMMPAAHVGAGVYTVTLTLGLLASACVTLSSCARMAACCDEAIAISMLRAARFAFSAPRVVKLSPRWVRSRVGRRDAARDEVDGTFDGRDEGEAAAWCACVSLLSRGACDERAAIIDCT